MEKVLFLDLDGVLIDFQKRALEFHNASIDWDAPENKGQFAMDKILGISMNAFWEPLNTFEFWEEMDWMPDGKEILDICEHYCDNICLLTSPSAKPESSYGKTKWIRQELPRYKRKFLIGCSKEFCARPNAHLVDDRTENVASFTKAGGHGFLLPRPWNEDHHKEDLMFDLLKTYLEDNFKE
jgi:5'(3')-deoxyribonucleotidase